MTAFYAFVKWFIKVTLRLYFRKIKIEGIENIPGDTPLLITPNHQNALIDPLLVGAFMPIPIHYLTRSDVFKPWTKPILKRVNMMPIYRIRDGYSKLSLNDDVFAACKKVFKMKGSILIFAEGNHGKEYYLRPLTKGAARLALFSQMEVEHDLMVLPVGLNYFEHRKPQSTVLIRFEKPVSVRAYLRDYEEHQAKGLIKMRDAISDGMKKALVIPDQTEDYEQRKAAIFQQVHESYSFKELKSIDPPDVTRERPIVSRHRIARILNPLPYLFIHRTLKRVDDVVFHSTLKFGIGLFVFPIWWLLVFFTLSITTGINIAALAVIVMATGLFYSYQR